MERTSQIRLLHVVGNSGFGGAARLILRLAQFARNGGWQVDVLTTNPSFQQAVRDYGLGLVDLDVIRRRIRPVWDTAGLFRLRAFLQREPYTIVHTHTSKAGFVGRLAARLAGIPVVVHTAHGFAFHERTPVLEQAVYSSLEFVGSLCCDRIVCVSEFHRQWALKLRICAARKIISIPNGIAPRIPDPRVSEAELRRSWGVGNGEFVILSMGRLAPEKGLEDLIEAAVILQKSGSRFRIVVAGDGPLRDPLSRMVADRGIADRVVFVGYREDVGNLLAACDQVVLPSLREGLSIALLEAMAAGKPIITTTIGSNVEVASQAEMAVLVAPGDPQALSQAILRCLRDPALRSGLGRNAQALFQERYTEDRMLSSYQQLYLELLKKKCPAATLVAEPEQGASLAGSVKL
jgi:glycosyltransferase involved in cell wall biosynthesis